MMHTRDKEFSIDNYQEEEYGKEEKTENKSNQEKRYHQLEVNNYPGSHLYTVQNSDKSRNYNYYPVIVNKKTRTNNHDNVPWGAPCGAR